MAANVEVGLPPVAKKEFADDNGTDSGRKTAGFSPLFIGLAVFILIAVIVASSTIAIFAAADDTDSPTANPTVSPTLNPTLSPTTSNPTVSPTLNPTVSPTINPTLNPTISPTLNPTVSPTVSPTLNPTISPTLNPTISPTVSPTFNPTVSPTLNPTLNPTISPTLNPTISPTVSPTFNPTVSPTLNPTLNPTISPTLNPTVSPTLNPTLNPTISPTLNPTISPTVSPTHNPTLNPTVSPTLKPSFNPTVSPTSNPTNSPTTGIPTESPTLNPVVFEVFPGEVRPGNGFVGVSFLVPVSESAGNSFVSAARRWNTILAGNENLFTPFTLTDFNICGAATIDQILVDHLFILATVEPDDGPGGVLGFAGPCNVANEVFIPIFGIMSFDSDDIDGLDAEGSLESVILHEMGHVLGIGTLWSFVGLIQNELPGDVPNADLPSPIYLGELGTQAFLDIGGDGSLGIEDGFTNGVLNGAVQGSVNGHFDEDSVNIELMTFQIKVTQPPLSTVTIQSLADLGYNVDVTQADPFFLGPSLVGKATSSNTRTDSIVLQGDIWIPDELVPLS